MRRIFILITFLFFPAICFSSTTHLPSANPPMIQAVDGNGTWDAVLASMDKALSQNTSIACWNPNPLNSFSDRISSLHPTGIGGQDVSRERLTKPKAGSKGKSWTLLFYDDADFYPSYDPLIDFASEAYSGINLDVLVLQDTYTGPAKLWYVNTDHSLTFLENWGEVDMGDYTTLRYFVDYGKTYYPSDRYFLAVYDHGGGWKGACIDETNGGWLSMNDFQLALTAAAGVDIICFTAPCLMASMESVYELREQVDVYIGSEELSGFIMWFGVIKPLCDLLNDNEYLTSHDIGDEIITLVEENPLYPSYKDDLTMSAIRTDKISLLADALDDLSKDLNASMGDFAYTLFRAREETKEFGMSMASSVGAIDLYDFILKYSSYETDPVIQNGLAVVEAAFFDVVIATCHGPNATDANGLSIYYPFKENLYDLSYKTSLLDFSANTDWELFLETYYVNYPTLQIDTYAIPESMGGVVNFTLTAGTDNSNRKYLIVGGVSGAAPGTPLPGGFATLPINWDWFSDLEMMLLNTYTFSNFASKLNAQGMANAQLNVPPVSGAAGITMYFAYCCNNPFDFVSNSVAIEIIQ